jgi:hypothetical protein
LTIDAPVAIVPRWEEARIAFLEPKGHTMLLVPGEAAKWLCSGMKPSEKETE